MPVTFHHHKLANGLDIVAEIDPAAHTSAIGFHVKTGARDEAPSLMGVSHFLEHMMFKGTDTRSAADVDRDFDDIGANHNAFTTSEMTAFWAHCLPEHLPRATEVLADILRPAIRQRDFDDEKSVILEEIAMYEDQPFWVLYEQAMEAYYRAHPLSHRVLGTRDTIRAMTRDQMQVYFDDRYSADNTTVALAGRLDFEEAVAQIGSLCSAWPTTDTARRFPEPDYGREDFTLTSDTVNRHYCLRLTPAPPLDDDRRYAASILSLILGDAEGSRLYWALVETGLADEARAQYDGQDGVGTYLVYFTCPPNRSDEVLRVVEEQIVGLIDSVTDDDLERVRSKVLTGATLQGELPAGRMHRLGRMWTYTRRYRSLDEELHFINAVTLDDLRALWKAYPFEPALTGHLRPK